MAQALRRGIPTEFRCIFPEPVMTSKPHTDLAARILKVNHAGENGAIHIYTGQLFFARFTAPHMLTELIEETTA